MRSLLSLSSFFVFSGLFLAGAMLPSQATAQTVQTNEYIYIGFEAEDHLNKDERWVTTTPSTPTEENDPDGNHSDQAGGSTYLELLPDIRVTHEDEFGPPTAFWGSGGQGPQADYEVDFPEPGRYYVHGRVYSTGTEDNGMHVGLNGQWPDSGQRMQFCTAQHRAWWWGSAQRDAGGNGSCGTEKTIWLDVPSAGIHTVSISAREDGFELDRLALMKDLSGNTRVCAPTTLTGVSCRNGSIESADGFVDLRVILSAEEIGADPDVEPPNPTEVVQGSNIKLTAIVENLDAFDTASDIVVTLSPVPGEWEMISMDSRCEADGDEFKCSLASLHPTAPNENESYVFIMQSLLDGDRRIDASLLSSDIDDAPANDVAATIVRVLPGDFVVPQQSDFELSMDTDKNQYETGESVALFVVIENVGEQADAVSFNLPIPSGLSLDTQSLPNECSYTTNVQCSFAELNASAFEMFNLNMAIEAAGIYSLSASINASLDVNAANDSDTDSFVASNPVEETTSSESSDTAGSTDEAETGTDGVGTTTSTFGGSDGGSSDEETFDGSDTSGGTTEGQTTVDTAGQSAGDTAGSDNSDTEDTVVATVDDLDSDTGALAHWFVMVMILMCLTRLYGLHQRKLVAIS